MTTPKTDALMALADRYAFHIPGSQHSDEARAVLLAALQEQALEGEAVANSAILARGRFHFFKGEDGEPDDWEWFEEGTNCEHGCIDAVIVRADAIAAPQPEQPSEPAHPEQGDLTGCACRWDADDNRVATCVRHQGWLDVVHEWAERAKSAETTLQSAQPEQGPPT